MLITADLGGRGIGITAVQTVVNEDDNRHDDEDNQDHNDRQHGVAAEPLTILFSAVFMRTAGPSR
jgi:hypothetical protein